MTEARVAAVEVYPLRRRENDWQSLVLRRAVGKRCPGSWEVIHGLIEPGEGPEQAAIRELREETGLAAARLYNVTVNSFYLQSRGEVVLSVAFAAVLEPPDSPTLSAEHDSAEWLSIPDAVLRYPWPRSKAILAEIAWLLRDGDGGPLEDVLRVDLR
jgi:8-oxo-dGTP pyrophosphatase MutT (NUDIX family)